MRGDKLVRKDNPLFLIALILGLGVAYLAINQAYDTGNAFWFSRPVPCFDSDNGLNYSVAGYTGYVRGSKRFDYCFNKNTLIEGWCSIRGGPTFTRYNCPFGCKNGACIKGSPCSDECSYSGLKECFLNGKQVGVKSCGNFDSDSCLEWSYSNCSKGFHCENGLCTQSDIMDFGLLSDRIRVCADNCEMIPTPVFKVCPTSNPNCNPKNYSFIEFYLGNLPLLTFQTPMDVYREGITWTGNKGYSYTENFKLSLVDGKGVVTQLSNHFRFEGTNKFLVYQDDFMDGSNPLVLTVDGINKRIYKPENITTNYEIATKEGNYGSINLIKREGFGYNLDSLYSKVLEITQNVDRLTNKNHVNFSVWLLPDPLSNYMGAGGNLYIGNGGVTIHYVEDSINDTTMVVAHEYTHAIQFERGPISNYLSNPGISQIRGSTSCFAEGLADGVAVNLGYKKIDVLQSGNQPEKGCVIKNYDMPHTVGRCIFKYLREDHIDSDTFYKSIFSPNHYYDFDTCDLSLRKTCDSYNVLFSEAAGQDLTQFMTQKIGGNCSSTLEEAKNTINLAPINSDDEAKIAVATYKDANKWDGSAPEDAKVL